MLSFEELNQLKIDQVIARDKATLRAKEFKAIKQAYCEAEAHYDDAIREYTMLDRKLAFAMHDEKTKKLRKTKPGKPYDSAKRTAVKVLKALESLPEELRNKILAQAQDGLF